MAEKPLTPCIKKVVILGPESTGKSTLSSALAQHFHTSWAVEYAREYIEQLDRSYIESDLLKIAKGQVATEESAIEKASNGITFFDTNLFVIKVWSEHRFKNCHPWILEQIAQRPYDLYLLADVDMPWEYDPQREYPELEMRSYFFELYKSLAAESGVPSVVISGNEEERLKAAIVAIGKYLSR